LFRLMVDFSYFMEIFYENWSLDCLWRMLNFCGIRLWRIMIWKSELSLFFYCTILSWLHYLLGWNRQIAQKVAWW
jgi:hypothetical protein